MSHNMRNVLSLFIKYNKSAKKSIYGINPLLKAIDVLDIDDLNKLQNFNFYESNGKMKWYPSELKPIYKKLDRDMDDLEDTRYVHSGGSMVSTTVHLQYILKDIDLDMFKEENDKENNAEIDTKVRYNGIVAELSSLLKN